MFRRSRQSAQTVEQDLLGPINAPFLALTGAR